MSQTSTATELQSYPNAPQPIAQPFTAYPKSHGPTTSIEDTRPINVSNTAATAELLEAPDKKTTAIVLLTVVCVTMIGSITSGVVIVALHRAVDLALGEALQRDVERLLGRRLADRSGHAKNCATTTIARCSRKIS